MSLSLTWQIRRTDRRMNGVEHFEYVASPKIIKHDIFGTANKSKYLQLSLIEVREWCWQTWGPSCELTFFMSLQGVEGLPTDRWCWHTEFDSHKIYLKTDKEANWFKLKWL